jgi:MerR family transcriptional regulator, light-induced transcriptional regulator
MESTAIQASWRDTANTLVEATCAFHPAAIEMAVSRCFSLGEPAEVFDNVIVPAMRRIGDLWAARRISVAQEHLVSGMVEGALFSLHRLVQPRARGPSALLVCLQDEMHTLTILGVSLHFAAWGVRTVVLGARTPPSAVADAVAAVRPALVGISATVSPPRHTALPLLRAYGQACGDLPWIVGGAAALFLSPCVEAAGGRVVVGTIAESQREIRHMLTEAIQRKAGASFEH